MWVKVIFTNIHKKSNTCAKNFTHGLQSLPNLTNEHIKFTPYSKMNVRLAAQVLSSTVSKVLLAYDPPEATETSHFCSLIDCFFDSMNVQNTLSYAFE